MSSTLNGYDRPLIGKLGPRASFISNKKCARKSENKSYAWNTEILTIFPTSETQKTYLLRAPGPGKCILPSKPTMGNKMALFLERPDATYKKLIFWPPFFAWPITPHRKAHRLSRSAEKLLRNTRSIDLWGHFFIWRHKILPVPQGVCFLHRRRINRNRVKW